MSQSTFSASRQSGVHARLVSMVGTWVGTTQVWFEPGPPAMEMAQRGRLRSVLGGRFLLHEYVAGEGDDASDGIALYGAHLDAKAFESAWVDSFHTGTSILWSTADDVDGVFRVLGSYGDGAGGPRWGWRTELVQPDADTLVITMTNIAPDGEEARAVETRYLRVE